MATSAFTGCNGGWATLTVTCSMYGGPQAAFTPPIALNPHSSLNYSIQPSYTYYTLLYSTHTLCFTLSYTLLYLLYPPILLSSIVQIHTLYIILILISIISISFIFIFPPPTRSLYPLKRLRPTALLPDPYTPKSPTALFHAATAGTYDPHYRGG